MTSSAATALSAERLLAVEPELTEIAPLSALRSIPERTLLHAGPPLINVSTPPAPLLNGVLAAIVVESWAPSRAAALDLFESGDVKLAPAQNLGVVTPLAFVAGPSTWCLKVEDAATPSRNIVSPLNDGPPPIAPRFGIYKEEGIRLVRSLADGIGTNLNEALKAPFPLLTTMSDALAHGDDLHGRVSAMQERLLKSFDNQLSAQSSAYLESAGQFALNAVMAAAALMIGAGAGVAESRMIIACGGNGENIGYKLASAPDEWLTLPATQPVGPRLSNTQEQIPIPAIGDSAVIDALGFGAACLRFCPEIRATLTEQFDQQALSPAFLDDRAHKPFLTPHPTLKNDAIRLGLDLDRSRDCLGIMLGMVEETGQHGLIGRGIAPWPMGH